MNHNDDLWCYYSDLPSVMSYEQPKKNRMVRKKKKKIDGTNNHIYK